MQKIHFWEQWMNEYLQHHPLAQHFIDARVQERSLLQGAHSLRIEKGNRGKRVRKGKTGRLRSLVTQVHIQTKSHVQMTNVLLEKVHLKKGLGERLYWARVGESGCRPRGQTAKEKGCRFLAEKKDAWTAEENHQELLAGMWQKMREDR